MQPTESVALRGTPERLLRWLVFATLVDLVALLVVVIWHGLQPADGLVTAAQVVGALLGALAFGSAAVGLAYAWGAYPQHRRTMIFVVVITLVVLLAHAYVIGNPAAGAAGSVSGAVNTKFNSDKLTVTSTLSGQELNVTITAGGGSALADVALTSGGAPLQGPGTSSLPTFASPLEPGNTVTGVWSVPAGGASAKLNVTYQTLSCYSTSSHTYGCIMDEVFYVPEGMGILSGQNCSPTGTNCHLEHPVLVPALIAGGMAIFGTYNVVGWRFFPALFGAFSIPLMFGIAWKVSGSKRLAYISTLLLALDVMFFSQSSGGLLDVPEIFFGLAGFFAYFANLKLWKLDRYVISGILFGVAGLAKETAVFIVLAFLTYIFFFQEGRRQARIYDVLKVSLVVGLVFSAGLQAYDSTLASAAFPTFVKHISYIFSYGSSLIANKLACQPATGYWCKFPNDPGGAPILPTDWILYYSPVAYYATSVTVSSSSSSYSYVAIAYYGVTNLLETWTVFVWVPLAAYVLYSRFKVQRRGLEQYGFDSSLSPSTNIDGETRFAGFALTLFLWTYVPYILLFIGGRVTYPFYFIPAIPAVAMGCAYWVTRAWFPRWLLAIYLGMVFVFFFVYFPEKAFLPDWLRVIIGH